MQINDTQLKNLEILKTGQLPEKIDTTIQKENSKYKVIEKITYKIFNQNLNKYKYYYYYIIACKICGNLKKISIGDFDQYENRECSHCKNYDKWKSFIGYKNQAYEVLNFDHKNRENRLFYKVKCLKCGSELIMRKDSILGASDKGCIKCKGNNKIPNSNSIKNILFGHYKSMAIYRGLHWDLTKEQFNNLISENCYYCGNTPKEQQSLKRYNKTGIPVLTNGVDRIDSNKGYSIDNCVPCCTICNRMKLNYSLTDFQQHINQIYNHMRSSTTISKESTSEANVDGKGESLNILENDIV